MCVRYITDHILHPGLPDACVALKQEVTEQLFMVLCIYAFSDLCCQSWTRTSSGFAAAVSNMTMTQASNQLCGRKAASP